MSPPPLLHFCRDNKGWLVQRRSSTVSHRGDYTTASLHINFLVFSLPPSPVCRLLALIFYRQCGCASGRQQCQLSAVNSSLLSGSAHYSSFEKLVMSDWMYSKNENSPFPMCHSEHTASVSLSFQGCVWEIHIILPCAGIHTHSGVVGALNSVSTGKQWGLIPRLVRLNKSSSWAKLNFLLNRLWVFYYCYFCTEYKRRNGKCVCSETLEKSEAEMRPPLQGSTKYLIVSTQFTTVTEQSLHSLKCNRFHYLCW